MQKIFVVEHSAWRQMKENFQIYLPYQFCLRVQSVNGDAQLSHEKMKTLFFWNMSKSRRLTLTFFPTMFSTVLFNTMFNTIISAFRDKGDSQPFVINPFTTDVRAFKIWMGSNVQASGKSILL